MPMPCERFVQRWSDEVPSQSDCLDRSQQPVKRFPVDVDTLVTCTPTCPRFTSAQVVLKEETDRSHRSPS